MILIIDNYDSFVYNLARYTGKLGRERQVIRNNAAQLRDMDMSEIQAIIISPGPCSPEHAGYSKRIIEKYGDQVPILGVCLGHQCIGEVYGGKTIRAPRPMHGKISMVHHNGQGLFLGLPNPIRAARYHSLCIDLADQSHLSVTAHCDEDLRDEDLCGGNMMHQKQPPSVIMAVEHETNPVYGIQFHPESILTQEGLDILRNFFMIADQWNMYSRGKNRKKQTRAIAR